MKKLWYFVMIVLFGGCASQSVQQSQKEIETGGIAAQKVVVLTSLLYQGSGKTSCVELPGKSSP